MWLVLAVESACRMTVRPCRWLSLPCSYVTVCDVPFLQQLWYTAI